MPNNLSGQVDLVAAIEGTALAPPASNDIASFTDGTLTDTAADFTATIDWGDGVTTIGTVVGSNGSFTVAGGHTYVDDDFVTPVVTITRTTDSSQLVLFGGVNVADADNLTGHSAAAITASPNQALTNVLVATFSDTYTGHPDGSDFTVNIDWGDGTTTAGTVTGSGGSFSVTGSHTYATAGQFTITTFMGDDSPDTSFASANTLADIGFGGTEVLNAANETVAIAAGTTVATFADNAGLASTNYTATIDWGDGTTTAGVVSGSSGSFSVTSAVSHTYADEGQFTEVVTITRTTDNATIAPTGTVSVGDTDVLVGSGTTIRSDPNAALTNVTVATFTDSNTVNGAGDFVATIDWGDGTVTQGTVLGSAGAFTVDGSHTYTQNGQDAISVSVTEEPDNPEAVAFTSVASTALVGLAPVSGASISLAEDAATVAANTQVGTFSDSNNSDTAASFTASIDWGDGTTTAGTVTGGSGTFTVSGGPHTYTGAFDEESGDIVTTTLTRTSDSTTATATGTVFISDSDNFTLTADNISGSQGTPINNAQVATFTDTYTGHADGSDFVATIDWGDGTITQGTVLGSGGSFTVDGSHTYVDAGTDTVTVSVADPGGTANASGTSTATIAARTLVGTMVLTAAVEAAALPAGTVVATFTDSITSDMAGDFTAMIDWGDGNTTTGTVVGSNGSFTVEGGHTYGDEGSDPAVVTLTHTSDNAQATASGSVAVTEADVLTGHGETFRPHANQPFTGEVATFTDTNTANVAGDFTATIDWGDGTTTTGTVSGGSGTLTVDGTHTYTHPGHENVTVTLADDVPGIATATALSSANVNNAKNDFNGDGKSDILFQSSVGSLNGGLQIDFMNGTSVASQATLAGPGLTWHVVGSGDFNADGKSDILFQNADGTPQIWTMNGSTVTSQTVLADPGATWTAVATGDFNGDGKADIAFQNANGTPMIWEMNGTSVAATATLSNPGAQWKLVGTGDFNDDGKSDLVFAKGNGNLMIWEMNGTSVASTATLSGPGAQWKLIGTGDFNGDGNSDLLFQKGDGTPMIEELNGTSVATTATLANPGATWKAIGTGDYNGDGKSDILFQNVDGTPMVWTMNGTSVTASATLPNPGLFAHANTG